MKEVSIIGFGRFGKTLYRLIQNDFDIRIYDNGSPDIKGHHLTPNTSISSSLEEIYKSDIIFFAVPISSFENVIKKHKKLIKPHHVLIDVLSVKIHPKRVFMKYIKDMRVQILLTHPMFGPDSSKNGFDDLPIILDIFRTDKITYNFWKEYFLGKRLRVIEMTAKEHDKLAADSQGLTHFVGRLLENTHFKKTTIDSIGTKKLHEVMEQTIHDTWELFSDLQTYNPYTKQMRLSLGKSYQKLYNKILPAKINPKLVTFGIQGGIESFSEQALLKYIKDNSITEYEILYLYTTEKVLKSLHEGNIDYGLFAITNSTGGIVEESMQALAKYSSSIMSDFEIPVKHFLMTRKDVDAKTITTIMAHPQVFAQCKQTLMNNFSQYKLISGEGDLVDTARAAEYLATDKLPKATAILGAIGLAEKYNLDIIAENLQDKKDNLTRFLLVKR